MAASYEEINYGLRPAKQIERKMICEAIRKLVEFGSMESYRYVGFGSIYFSDFSMFHRQLNIRHMLSVEKDDHKKDRFEFNRPFDCIEVRYGHSNEILPAIGWSERSIVWLDYDDMIDGKVVNDIKCFCANAVSGSMLIVSVNVQYTESETETRLERLRNSVGSELVPIETEEKGLAGWNAAGLVRRIISNVIERGVSARNGGRKAGYKFAWKQLMGFEYAERYNRKLWMRS